MTAATTAPRTARRTAVTVVGDVVLDRDVTGEVSRVSPDAPVPVVDVLTERSRPGGAGLVACLTASWDVDVTLATAIADDDAGHELRRMLTGAGVRVVELAAGGATAEKVRVRADGQSLLRVDWGGPPGAIGPASSAVREVIGDADALVVADYARGVATEPHVRALLEAAVAHTPVVWDPHVRGGEPVRGVRLATPNHREAATMARRPVRSGGDLVRACADAQLLRSRWQAAGVAVTMGAHGAVLVASGGPPLVVPPRAIATGDACGAGDQFAAAATVALARGAVLSEAVEEAVAAASNYVAWGGRVGMGVGMRGGMGAGVAVSAGAGVEDAASRTRAGEACPSAEEVVAAVRARAGTVVTAGGCFDLLHAGHVAMLAAARALGDCLIVLLNSDASVRRLKGPDRPLQPQQDRAAILAALDCVDAVVPFDGDIPHDELCRLRPDLFVKGGDYATVELAESATLAQWGGEVVVVPYLAGRSTSLLVEGAMGRGQR